MLGERCDDELARETLAQMRALFPPALKPARQAQAISLEDAAAHRERARQTARLYLVSQPPEGDGAA